MSVMDDKFQDEIYGLIIRDYGKTSVQDIINQFIDKNRLLTEHSWDKWTEQEQQQFINKMTQKQKEYVDEQEKTGGNILHQLMDYLRTCEKLKNVTTSDIGKTVYIKSMQRSFVGKIIKVTKKNFIIDGFALDNDKNTPVTQTIDQNTEYFPYLVDQDKILDFYNRAREKFNMKSTKNDYTIQQILTSIKQKSQFLKTELSKLLRRIGNDDEIELALRFERSDDEQFGTDIGEYLEDDPHSYIKQAIGYIGDVDDPSGIEETLGKIKDFINDFEIIVRDIIKKTNNPEDQNVLENFINFRYDEIIPYFLQVADNPDSNVELLINLDENNLVSEKTKSTKADPATVIKGMFQKMGDSFATLHEAAVNEAKRQGQDSILYEPLLQLALVIENQFEEFTKEEQRAMALLSGKDSMGRDLTRVSAAASINAKAIEDFKQEYENFINEYSMSAEHILNTVSKYKNQPAMQELIYIVDGLTNMLDAITQAGEKVIEKLVKV